MRTLCAGMVTVLLAASLAGCSESPIELVECEEGVQDVTLWFDGGDLRAEPPGAGSRPGNGFMEAFLTDDMRTWDSPPLGHGLRIEGDVTLEFWARNVGTPAPIVLGGDPGEAYHFFNQFGSDRTFQPSYAVEYADVAPAPGSVDHYNETFTMPEGGFFVEPGDRIRVLLTSLVLDDASGSGHLILYGGETPSRVSFQATCWTPPSYERLGSFDGTLTFIGNHGLLTGAIPPTEGVNTGTVWFDVLPETERLTVAFEQSAQLNPLKDDLDLYLVDGAGDVVWTAGSPYSTETTTLWKDNLDAIMPPGTYGARVDSYSGVATTVRVTITQDAAATP